MTVSPALKLKISNFGSTRILLTLIFILAITFSLTQVLDTTSKKYIDKAFNRALITFGVSKALNGVISVVQGTEVAIQPAGIGINLMPGQILDPINDLIERFSWVMLASTTSLGIQKIFLIMSMWPAFNALLITFITFSLFLLFIKSKKYTQLRTFILRCSLLLIVLRFIIPFSALTNALIYQVFLEDEYIASSEVLKSSTEKISLLNKESKIAQPDIKKKSVWESAKAFYHSTSEMLDINKKIEKYKQAATETTRHIINLIVVFIFQTILIPLAFLFILYTSMKFIVRIEFNFNI